MTEVIVMRLFYEGEHEPIPARQALYENVLPALRSTGKWRIHSVAGTEFGGIESVVGEELGTGNLVNFNVEEVR